MQEGTPRRLEEGNADSEFAATQDHYRCIYFKALDLIITCIAYRFDQPGFKIYRNVQDLLLKAVKSEPHQAELDFVTEFYSTDFNGGLLQT